MKLPQFLMNYQLFCQILFLWLINFNVVFGCITTRYMKKDMKTKEFQIETPNLSDTLENIIPNTPDNESDIISSFQKFLTNNYNWNIKLFDLNILWNKLKEFSIKYGYTSRPCKLRKPKKIIKKSQKKNVTIMSLEQIKTYLKNEDKRMNIKGAAGTDRILHKASVGENIYFSKSEKLDAFRNSMNYNELACKLRIERFCIRDFLKIEKGEDDLSQSIPPAILLNRCPTKCSCFQPHEDCLPTSVRDRKESVYTANNDNKQSTYALVLVDHDGCECRDRCLNRKCISPFEVITQDVGSCECQCIPGHEKMCKKVLNGYHHFNVTEYNCIVSGKCIVPDCTAGRLSEEQLYLRHCPVEPY